MILREGGKERRLTVVWSCLPPRRSVVYQQSSRESATLQPFFTLQLDIQSDKIRTVQDALESLVARESVQGYTTKTKQEVQPQLVLNACAEAPRSGGKSAAQAGPRSASQAPCFAVRTESFHVFRMGRLRGAWVAQSVKRPTSARS